MTARDRMLAQLHIWWAEYLKQPAAAECVVLRPPDSLPDIDEADANGFLCAVDAKLLTVHENGWHFHSRMMRTPAGGLAEGHLFEHQGSPKIGQLRAENIVHWATVAELVLDYGWCRDEVLVESPRHGDLKEGSLDILVTPSGGRPAIAGEAKYEPRKLAKLVAEMRTCGGVRPESHRGTLTAKTSDHRKCRALLAFETPIFLGAAGGTRLVLPVSYGDGAFVLGTAQLGLDALRAPSTARASSIS